MDNKKDRRRGGFYFKPVDGKEIPYISTTEILRVIAKPQVIYWHGKQIYLAMVANPSLSEEEALAVPRRKMKDAMARGTTVHSIVEGYVHTQAHIADKVAEEFKPYAEAFYRFVEEHRVKITGREKTVFSDKYGYAGTLDLEVSMYGEKGISLGDVKTGKALYPEVALQLSAYKNAYEETNRKKVSRLFALLLREDGKYTYEEQVYNLEGFLAAKSVWEAVNRDKVEAVSYQSPGLMLRLEDPIAAA